MHVKGSLEFNAAPHLYSVTVHSGCCNKSHRLARYQKHKCISHSPGGWKSQMRAPALLGSGEGPLPDYKLTSPCVLTWWKGQASSLEPLL